MSDHSYSSRSSYGGSYSRPTPPSIGGGYSGSRSYSGGYSGGYSSGSSSYSRPTPPSIGGDSYSRSTYSGGSYSRPTPPSSGGSYGGSSSYSRPTPPSVGGSYSSGSSGYSRPTPPSVGGSYQGGSSSYSRPTPPSVGGYSGGSYSRPVPPATGGSYGGRPVPPSVGGGSYGGRPLPPSVNGSYGRPVPPPVYNRPSHYVDNTYIYAPTYYETPFRNYSGWGGDFWSGYATGYLVGSLDQAVWDSAYHNWSGVSVGTYWDVPYHVWNPYYTQVLALPPGYIDYTVPAAYEHPALNPQLDPLEQLAFYGQLKKPDHVLFFTTHDTISAEEARVRLNAGLEVDVAGVPVTSFQQLAAIVPEMARGNAVQGQSLPSDAQAALQHVVTQQAPDVSQLSQDDLAGRLPAFSEVYSPRSLQAEDQVNGKNVNRTMDAAQAVYARPEVKAQIAAWWKQNPGADRDALNRAINGIVTKALTDDLTANGAAYASQPTTANNPVDYLKDPSASDAAAYNQKAIQTVLTNAPDTLQRNLITKATATLQQ